MNITASTHTLNNSGRMRFGSVCSGIEAASVAWEPLGLRASWFAEVEAFPSAVLAHRWPEVLNTKDMNHLPLYVREGWVAPPDILVGGTPCQAFSVAGLRKGLEDERGQLTIKYVELADEIDRKRTNNECVIVWENVPGVLSSKDNAFGCFLGALAGEECELQPAGVKWSNAGCVFGPKRTVAWRVLDAQYFGVAQRRRRVFVVASARNGFDPGAVLFESEGVRRDTPPSREQGKAVAALTARGVGTCGADDNQAQAGHLLQVTRGPLDVEICGTLTAGFGKLGAPEVDAYTAIPVQAPTGRAWPAEVACTLNAAFGDKLGLEDQHVNGGCPLFVPAPPIRFDNRQDLITYPIQKATRGKAQNGLGIAGESDPMYTLDVGSQHGVGMHESVRRLTPVECERLQGFPDNHTRIPWRSKDQEDCPDGPRYKAIGNSMAVPVMRWIGERILKHFAGEI